MNKIILIGLITAILVVAGIAIAKGVERNPATVASSGRTVMVPDQATDNSPALEKAIFIHYKKGFGKPGTECGNGVCEPSENTNNCPADCGSGSDEKPAPTSSCYAFLGKWVKWQELPVGYAIDPANPDGLLESFVVGAISAGAKEWDAWTGADLFNDTYVIISDGSWDSGSPDGRNEILFGNYPQEGVIAVTVVWGYFSGPPSSRKIVEFDILLDTNFVWGDATLDPAVMDLQNIATHELGHGAGLADLDLYETTCVDETMYGYSNNGEIKKRDLNAGDIMGIQALYGGL